MPNYKISAYGLDPDRTVIATGRNLSISPKHSREIVNAIRGMKLEDAQAYLEEVIKMRRSVPFRRHRKKVSHRSDIAKWDAGRYPVKASKEILKVLENLSNNSTFKGFDLPRIKLVHVTAQRGRKLPGIFPRAQGRSSPKIKTLTHIEVVGEEV